MNSHLGVDGATRLTRWLNQQIDDGECNARRMSIVTGGLNDSRNASLSNSQDFPQCPSTIYICMHDVGVGCKQFATQFGQSIKESTAFALMGEISIFQGVESPINSATPSTTPQP